MPLFHKKPKELTIKKLSEELPFFPKRKKRKKRLTKYQILRNILPFFDTVGIVKNEHDHRGYAESYNVEVMDNKSLDDSLFLARRSIKYFFKDLLEEKRGFKYILGAEITLKRWNNVINMYDIERIYIRSHAVTVINQRSNLEASYEIIKNILDIWTAFGCGWITDKIENINIDIANYDPLVGSSYFPLPPELRNSMKGLINLKNKDIKYFKWCHVRLFNPQNKDGDRMKKQHKKIEYTLDYRGINFPMKARDYEIIEERFNINVNVFGYENSIFPLHVSKKFNEQVLNVLLISNEQKSEGKCFY